MCSCDCHNGWDHPGEIPSRTWPGSRCPHSHARSQVGNVTGACMRHLVASHRQPDGGPGGVGSGLLEAKALFAGDVPRARRVRSSGRESTGHSRRLTGLMGQTHRHVHSSGQSRFHAVARGTEERRPGSGGLIWNCGQCGRGGLSETLICESGREEREQRCEAWRGAGGGSWNRGGRGAGRALLSLRSRV